MMSRRPSLSCQCARLRRGVANSACKGGGLACLCLRTVAAGSQTGLRPSWAQICRNAYRSQRRARLRSSQSWWAHSTRCESWLRLSFIRTDPPLAAGAVVLSHLLALRAPAQPFHTVRAFGHNASCSWLTYSLSLQARTSCGAWLLVPSASLLLQQQPTCWSFCVLHGTQFMQSGPHCQRGELVACRRYRSVAERMLGAELSHSRDDMSRILSLDFLNRQLVWRELSDLLLFVLPLLRSLKDRHDSSCCALTDALLTPHCPLETAPCHGPSQQSVPTCGPATAIPRCASPVAERLCYDARRCHAVTEDATFAWLQHAEATRSTHALCVQHASWRCAVHSKARTARGIK